MTLAPLLARVGRAREGPGKRVGTVVGNANIGGTDDRLALPLRLSRNGTMSIGIVGIAGTPAHTMSIGMVDIG